MIPQERVVELHAAIQQVPAEWRYRWCEGGLCACMGAANCAGGLGRAGFTRAEWEEWVAQNPPADELAQKFVVNGRFDKTAYDDYVWRGKKRDWLKL